MTEGISYIDADLMADCCPRCTDGAIYHPYNWRFGLANYACQHGHMWTHIWGHRESGGNPANQGRPQ